MKAYTNPIAGPQYQQGINVGQGRDSLGDSQMSNRAQSLGAAASLRGAYQADTTENDLARNNQNAALTLMNRAAFGQEPSAAEIAGRRALDQSLNNQLAGAASARGGALGQAAAMRQAQVNAGQFQAQAMQTMQAQRAAEMAQARQDYGQMSTAQRGQELQQMNQLSQNELAQRQLNQQAQMGYEQMGQQANLAQAQTDLGVAGLNANNWQSWQSAAQQQAGENYRMQQQIAYQKQQAVQNMIMGGVGAAASMGAAALTGGGSAAVQAGAGAAAGAAGGGGGDDEPDLVPPKADGGPVSAGKPYLVGERGPELVIPRQDGHVIPAEPTAALMSGPSFADKLSGRAPGYVDAHPMVPLMDSSEGTLQATPDMRAYYTPRLEAPPVHPAFAPSATVIVAKPTMAEAAARRAKMAPPQRQMTYEEMLAAADRMRREMQAEHEARMAQGPAVLMVRP